MATMFAKRSNHCLHRHFPLYQNGFGDSKASFSVIADDFYTSGSNKHIRRLKAKCPPYKPSTFFMNRSMAEAWEHPSPSFTHSHNSPIQSTSCLKSNNQLLWRVTHHFLQIFQVWWKVATGQAHLVTGPKHPWIRISVSVWWAKNEELVKLANS